MRYSEEAEEREAVGKVGVFFPDQQGNGTHVNIIGAGLGLDHDCIMKIGLSIVALVSSITIVGVGNIPCLGLVVPNLVSIYRGDSIKDTLFDTAWLGPCSF